MQREKGGCIIGFDIILTPIIQIEKTVCITGSLIFEDVSIIGSANFKGFCIIGFDITLAPIMQMEKGVRVVGSASLRTSGL